jgi:hypothetical protein
MPVTNGRGWSDATKDKESGAVRSENIYETESAAGEVAGIPGGRRCVMASAIPESCDGPGPIYLRNNGFVVGVLQTIEPMEDGILAVIEGIRVFLPQDLEGKLQGLEGRDVVVATVDGQWRAAALTAGRRRREF